jgi:hypothetical protein
MYLPLGETWPARWMNGVASIRYPRRQHAEFRRWLKQRIGDEPALVLVDAGSMNPHLDLVVNDAGLTGPLLLGRYRPGVTDPAEIARDFPDRTVYVVRWEDRELIRITPFSPPSPDGGPTRGPRSLKRSTPGQETGG